MPDPRSEPPADSPLSEQIDQASPAPGTLLALLDTVPEPLVVVGEDRRILFANEAMNQMFGYAREELGERPVEDLVRSKDRRECLHAFGETLEAGKSASEELALDDVIAVDADEEPFPARFRLRPLMLNETRFVLATVHDRRDEIQARLEHAALDQAREKIDYQKTLLESQNEASIDGILIVNEDSKIVSYNQRFLDVWNIDEDLIEVGRTDEEALTSVLDNVENVDSFLETIEHLSENPNATVRDEVHLKDGTVLERWSTPVISEEGAKYGRGWYFRDITERKRIEQALREHRTHLEQRVEERTEDLEDTARALREEVQQRKHAEEQLEQRVWELAQSNADLERFAYVASHDLQEPLRMIASYLQLLERRYKDELDADANEYIDYAVEGARRMQSLIRDLLAYARIGSDARREPVPLDHVIDRVLDRLLDQIEAVEAHIERPDAMGTVVGNPSQLVQALEALVANALKFHQPEQVPTVRILSKPQNEGCFVAVEDEGVGIEPDYQAQVFELFQRLHPRGAYEGTGIGLSLAKKVVENHGGEVWIESHGARHGPADDTPQGVFGKPPTSGTRVCLRLPKHPSPDPDA